MKKIKQEETSESSESEYAPEEQCMDSDSWSENNDYDSDDHSKNITQDEKDGYCLYYGIVSELDDDVIVLTSNEISEDVLNNFSMYTH